MATVISVSVKKQGVGRKGAWTMYEAVLDNGTKASGFDLVAVGDTVSVEQQGQYLNYKKSANGAPQAQAPRQQAPWAGSSDDRSNRIERQHSQEMAIRTADLMLTNGMISTPEELKAKLKELTDYYQRDVGRSPAERPMPRSIDVPEDIPAVPEDNDTPY